MPLAVWIVGKVDVLIAFSSLPPLGKTIKLPIVAVVMLLTPSFLIGRQKST